MTIQLQLRETSSLPIEIEGVTPDALRERSLAEIERFPIFHGNRQLALAELFTVSGNADDEHLVLEGDCSAVHWIGAKMEAGSIRVDGNAGRHVGSEMRGGAITIAGNASDWLGGEMRGGEIHVHGNAGHLVGAAYRGSPRGMRGGSIYVHGSAGNEIGHSMRRGTIMLGESIGDLAGFNMLAGTILALSDGGIRHGAGMRRGTIAILGTEPVPPLPTFRYACRIRPLAIEILLRSAVDRGMPVPERLRDCEFALHHGDFLAGGRGELLTCATAG